MLSSIYLVSKINIACNPNSATTMLLQTAECLIMIVQFIFSKLRCIHSQAIFNKYELLLL